MLQKKILKMSADAQALRQEIHDTIMSQPEAAESGLGFTVSSKDVYNNNHVLSAKHYDTGSQLRQLAGLVIKDNPPRSLESILSIFQRIADTGTAPSVSVTPFSERTREIIRSML